MVLLLDEAEAAYERAIAASPESGFLYRELAAVEQQRGNLDEARFLGLSFDAQVERFIAQVDATRAANAHGLGVDDARK